MQDAMGLPVSTPSESALTHYNLAVDRMVRGWPGVPQAAQAALAHAPDFLLAHCVLVLYELSWSRRAAALLHLDAARANLARAHPRETSHVDIVAHIANGRPLDALRALHAHVQAWPRDAVVVGTALGAYGLFAFSGSATHNRERLDFVEALAPHYPNDAPWFLAHRGWARIELGALDEGLAMARESIRQRPENAHAAHIVSHGLHEQGEPQQNLDFLAEWLPCYPSDGLMAGHLHWHAALAELEQDDDRAALARLHGPILDYLPRGTPYMGLPDIAGLLWRLGLRGHADLPWARAAEHAQAHFPKGSNPFGELHLAMIAAARRDESALLASATRLEKSAASGHEGARVAREWALGLAELVRGSPARAQAHLACCLAEIDRLGGSHAQRGAVLMGAEAGRLPEPSP